MNSLLNMLKKNILFSNTDLHTTEFNDCASESETNSEGSVSPFRLFIKKLYPDAKIPTKAFWSSAGYDLYAYVPKSYNTQSIVILPKERSLILTGIKLALPTTECYGRIAPRSGLSVKYGIDIGAGVIDYEYRGEVGIVLINNGKDAFEVKHGDKIAQLIIERTIPVEIEEVEELDKTERNENGFGSTGM